MIFKIYLDRFLSCFKMKWIPRLDSVQKKDHKYVTVNVRLNAISKVVGCCETVIEY